LKPNPVPPGTLAAPAGIESLARAEERLRQVLENASEGILVAQEGRFRYANPAALAITGYAASEIEGVEFVPMVHPEDRARVIDHHVRRLRGEPVEPRYEFRVLTRAGAVRWVQLSAVMIQWDGQPATLSFIADITERRAAVEALEASEARFRDFANASSDWFWETDAGHRYTWFSGALERAVARPPSAYLGRTRMEVAQAAGADVSAEPWTSHLAALARHEPFRDFVQQRQTPAGERWMSVSGVPRFDAAGRFLGYRGAVSNVTALVESERRARASEARYRSVVEGAPIGIVIVQDNRLKYVNPAFARMARATIEELLARDSILERVHPADRERMTALARNAVKRPTGDTLRVAYRILRDDGTTLSMDVSSVQVEWEGRRATLGFVQDVGDRLQLEEDLKRSLEERELILENSVVGIAFLTHDGRLKWANRAMAQIFGASLDARYGQSLERNYPSREAYLATGAAVSAAVLAGRTYDTELQMRREDGTLIWVHLSGKAVNANDLSQGSIWTLVDVSARKQGEQDIRAALDKQRELNQLKSRFVSMTSHEFRTPLATILSSSQLLRRYGERLPESERGELFDTIETAVKRMDKMLEDILVIGRAESDRLEFRPAPVRLASLCEKILADARAAVPAAAGTAWDLVLDAVGAGEVNLDAALLRHILDNLLANAVKYSPGGGRITLSARARGGTARFMVSDPGIGMAKEDVPRIFDAFTRASNVGNISGTGLGLAIVRHCVDLHGGTIEVDSELGKGTRFTVTLPCA